LERYSLPLALCLIAIAAVRIVSTYTAFADVGDEPAHLACGLEYVAQHVYRYETQHPPLARAMAALGPYLDGARPVGEPNPEWEGDAILCHSGHPGRTLFLAPAGSFAVLPAGVPGGLFLGPAPFRKFGRGAGHGTVHPASARPRAVPAWPLPIWR